VGTPASESQTIISYCFFAENKAWVVQGNNPCYNGGGGMYNHFCSPVVESCTFEQNYSRYGGGMCNAGPPASPTVTNCVFNTNNAIDDGGGMYNSISDPVVTNCVFNANWARREGGGIYYHGCANASIVNSTFYRNGWGTCLGPSECSWFEALAVSTLPYTRAGGAIYIEDGCIRCTMTNVIFDSNAARYDGGAVFNNQPNYSPAVRKTFESCLFHGNISQEWSCFSGCQWIEPTPAPDHIYGTLDESNSLYDLDPLFVNASDGDFHLQYDSPCIDAGYYGKHGNHSSWPAHLPDTDFEGDRRVIDGDGDDTPAVDIGADEYKPE